MASSTPHEVDECRGVLRVFSDGSTVRSPGPSFPAPVIDKGLVEWKDVRFDPTHDLHLRLYKPRVIGSKNKLPVFYYFHGGGFCIGSRTWPNCQNYCLRLASDLNAVIVSPDYRLAPENRLPAAIDDAVTALEWLRDGPDAWLVEFADLGSVFVSGDSAGGTIAHHLAVRYGSSAGRAELAPVRVRGYVLLGPFFGGTVRTESEAECPEDAFLNLELNDRFWRLSVPVGSDRDDPLANPFGGGAGESTLEGVEFEPVLIVVGGCDLLRDRAVEYGEKLRQWGKPVEVAEFAGQQHGFFTIRPWDEPANELMLVVKRFVDENGTDS